MVWFSKSSQNLLVAPPVFELLPPWPPRPDAPPVPEPLPPPVASSPPLELDDGEHVEAALVKSASAPEISQTPDRGLRCDVVMISARGGDGAPGASSPR